METSKVIQVAQDQSPQAGLVFSAVEKKQLADFFAVLIEIDRRVNITKHYDKQTK
jgi:hypothetical protein